MKSKHEERAKELCSTLFEEPCNWEENSIESDFLNLMCQLADEVESGKQQWILNSQDIYSKQQVEELLQKQRELSSNLPCIKFSSDRIDILNTKLKID